MGKYSLKNKKNLLIVIAGVSVIICYLRGFNLLGFIFDITDEVINSPIVIGVMVWFFLKREILDIAKKIRKEI